MTCRDCKFIRAEPDKDGKVRILNSQGYWCRAPVEWPPKGLPDSVILSRSFPLTPPKTWVSPSDGENCAAFTRRTKEKQP